jgi:chromosome segregation ATPase
MTDSGSSAKVVKDQVNGLRDAYKDTINQMIQYSKTQDSITAGFGSASAKFSELSTTLKANGDNLQNNGQLSQQSSQYMQSAASSALEAAKAQVVYGKANGDTAGSVQEAKNQIQSMRDQLVGTLTQYGMSGDAANKYADALGLIPGNVNTDAFLKTDVATSDLTAYLNRMQATPDQKKTVMNALTDQADGNVDNLHLKISDLPTWVNSVLTADNNDAKRKTSDATTSLRHFNGSRANASLTANNDDVKNKASAAQRSINSVPEKHKTDFTANQTGSGWSKIKDFFSGIPGALATYWGIGRANGGEVKRANGGIVQRLASGGPSGFVTGPGTSTSDSIPTWLSDGEYVIRAAAARKIGLQNLNRANATGKISGGTVVSSQPVVNQYISVTNKGVANPYVNGNIIGRSVASSARASLMGV